MCRHGGRTGRAGLPLALSTRASRPPGATCRQRPALLLGSDPGRQHRFAGAEGRPLASHRLPRISAGGVDRALKKYCSRSWMPPTACRRFSPRLGFQLNRCGFRARNHLPIPISELDALACCQCKAGQHPEDAFVPLLRNRCKDFRRLGRPGPFRRWYGAAVPSGVVKIFDTAGLAEGSRHLRPRCQPVRWPSRPGSGLPG